MSQHQGAGDGGKENHAEDDCAIVMAGVLPSGAHGAEAVEEARRRQGGSHCHTINANEFLIRESSPAVPVRVGVENFHPAAGSE